MRRNVLFGVLVIVACAVVAGVALSGSRVSTGMAFAEIETRDPSEPCEIYGELAKTSIHAVRGANLVRFDLVEEKTGRRMEVLYDNPAVALPANFPNASHVRANGTYNPAAGHFVANTVYTKCPSKYDGEKLDMATQQALERWRKETGTGAQASGATDASY